MGDKSKLISTGLDTYKCTVEDSEELELVLCDAIGRYAKVIEFYVKDKKEYQKTMEDFNIKYGAFYPNYTHISWQPHEKAYDTGIDLKITLKYRIGRVKLKMMEEETQAEVNRLCKLLFEPDMPDEAKILLAHNYIAYTVKYVSNKENPLEASYTQSAHGALIEKKCVCQGFAEAFKRLMDAAGIDCTYVHGQCVGSEGYHGWNTVSLGQKENTYHIDVTWDEYKDKPDYEHFCKPDSFYDGKRTWNKKYTPECPAKLMVLSKARAYIANHKTHLLAKGIDPHVLGI